MSTTATVSGALEREPEIRYTREGVAVTRLVVSDGDDRTEVVAFGELAENIALTLTRGADVIASGTLDLESKGTRAGFAGAKLIASDLGASLRNATADVMRVRRPDPA